MAITMQGSWTISVKSMEAFENAQRFLVTGAATGSGTYNATAAMAPRHPSSPAGPAARAAAVRADGHPRLRIGIAADKGGPDLQADAARDELQEGGGRRPVSHEPGWDVLPRQHAQPDHRPRTHLDLQ